MIGGVRVDVEYAHLYADAAYGAEQTASVALARDVKAAAGAGLCTASLLIDDYNASDAGFNLAEVVDALKTDGLAPDFVGYEASMAGEADQMLASFTSARRRRSYERYIARRGLVPCSFLTATWYLVRLGILDSAASRPTSVRGRDFVPAERLVNVLPSGYANVEAEAMEIIRATKHFAAADRISARYFPWVAAARVADGALADGDADVALAGGA